MSKIGKRPIPIPEGVRVTVTEREVVVEGPHGKLSQPYEPEYVRIVVENGQVPVSYTHLTLPTKA